MSKRIEPELPSIMPDIDQVEAYKQSTGAANNKASAAQPDSTTKTAPAKSTGITTWLGAVAIIALAAGSYGLYQQNQATKAQLFASEQRIAELERTLSATGEEMGESAGAMRAKLSELTEKTDELWSQMDKLWASAWRRNQSEIKELQKQTNNIASTQQQQGDTQSDVAATVQTLSQAQNEITLKMSLMQEQVETAQTLKSQLASLNEDLDKLKAQSQERSAQQVEIGSSMAQLEMTQNALTEKVERLERQLSSSAKVGQNLN